MERKWYASHAQALACEMPELETKKFGFSKDELAAFEIEAAQGKEASNRMEAGTLKDMSISHASD